MVRLIVVVAVVFFVLLALRAARLALARFLSPPSGARRPPAVEAEMVRDPVCGAWVDSRIALTGRQAGRSISVCSEECRTRLEKQA